MSEELPKIKIVESPDFKIIYATGLWGALDSEECCIILFIDRGIPKISEDDNSMNFDYVERQLQAEIHIPYQTFLKISDWAKDQIESVKKRNDEEAS